MLIMNLKNAYLSFYKSIILNNAELQVNKNERICLIGKNGAGKSTLFKILSNQQELDRGTITYKNGLKIAYLQQTLPSDLEENVYNFIIKQNYFMTKNLKISYSIKNNSLLNFKTSKKTKNQSQNQFQKIKTEQIIKTLNLKKYEKLSNLSGGELQKTILAKILINDSDLLLLDEPTNHLDLQTILWLEKFCINFPGSILFISHDRRFIQNTCTKIINLDKGNLIEFPGNYNKFIKNKELNNTIELIKNEKFKKKIKKEQEWLKKGIKARCTRNEGRVKILKNNQNIYANQIKNPNNIDININYNKNYQKIICKIRNVTYNIQKKNILKLFSETIVNGDKIALIGKNGSGKSTILKLILGKIFPTTGIIQLNSNLNISYFDQNCSILNSNKNILENISYGKNEIEINGKKKSITSYLQDFLFSIDQINQPIKTLSGGEKNRLQLAKIFLRPSNFLILDEPTNNLDIETLKILENAIINYKGTVILITHDRTFIDNTVKKCWCINNLGEIYTSIGGYSNVPKNVFLEKKQEKNITLPKKNINKKNFIAEKKFKNKKLSYHLQKELNNLPNLIEQIEKKISSIQKKMKNKKFFVQDQKKIISQIKELNQQEEELKDNFNRWNYLEKLKNN